METFHTSRRPGSTTKTSSVSSTPYSTTFSAAYNCNTALRELHSSLQLHSTSIPHKSLPSSESHQQTQPLLPIPPKNLIPPRHKNINSHKNRRKTTQRHTPHPRRLPHPRNQRIVREQNNPASVAAKARNTRRAPAIVVQSRKRQCRCDDHEGGVCGCEGFADEAGRDG